MEIVTNCANPEGREPSEPAAKKVWRAVGVAIGLVFALAGFCIMIAFSGPLYIEPHFQNTAQMIQGFGIFCLLAGARITVLHSVKDQSNRDVRTIKLLSTIGILLGILMIAMGAWGDFMS